MSHHFDTPTAREDPRINLCDFYLFDGSEDSTVFAMTVNPDAGLSAPDTFRDEGLYAFRFDLDGDAREEVAFKVTFGAPSHAGGNEHQHVQSFQLRRATAAAASGGTEGEIIASGNTGEIVEAENGVNIFAGLAPDSFAGDAAALTAFRDAFFKEHRFHPAAFHNRQNFFARRNISAIVVELPNKLIGRGLVHAWATVSLHGHAPEVQVSRWGLPLITNIFMPDMEMREAYNRAAPAQDVERFAGQICDVIEKLTALAASAEDPAAYASTLIKRLCPTMLPYRLGTKAVFEASEFNGRALGDDAMDVILSLATNTPLADGVAPDRQRIQNSFPYFGRPYTKIEQADVAPVRSPPSKHA
jgi:hypothetical protein